MKRVWVGLALLGLVAGNVALLVALVGKDPESGPSAAAPPSRPTPSDRDSDDADDGAPAEVTELFVADDGNFLRAARGSCTEGGQARLDISTDGGATFTEAGLPVLSDDDEDVEVLQTVLTVDAASVNELALVGNDAACDTRFFTSDDGGDSWQEQDDFDGWFVTASGSQVQSPDGPGQPGCEPLTVAAVSDLNAKVMCRDGSVRGTNDAGLTWTPFGLLPGGNGMAFATFARGYALAPDEGCASRAFESVDAGETWEARGCVSEETEPGPLVLRGAELVTSVDGTVRVSEDEGATWRTVGD